MIIPFGADVGLEETWEWRTDILATHNNTESRLSVRSKPRISQRAEFAALTQARRRDLWNVVLNNIRGIFTVPLWAWFAPITQVSAISTNRIYFDPALCPVSVSNYVVLYNPRTNDAQAYLTASILSDGATLTTNLTSEINNGYICYLAGQAAIENNSRIVVQQITAGSSFDFTYFVDPDVERPGSSASLTILNSLPVLERSFLEGSTEAFRYERELIDFETGARDLQSRWINSQIFGRKEFIVDRRTQADYWRRFLNEVKGSWKPFLLSTNMQDLTLGSSLTQNGTTVTVQQSTIDTLTVLYETFRHIEIRYSDRTSSYHRISSFVDNGNGTVTLTVSPNLPNNPKVANVSRISYLLKSRMSDSLTWRHDHLFSTLDFEVVTTDQG